MKKLTKVILILVVSPFLALLKFGSFKNKKIMNFNHKIIASLDWRC